MSTLVEELEQAANYAENCDAVEAAARLRKRVEHIKRLRDECQSMTDAHLFYALTGDL